MILVQKNGEADKFNLKCNALSSCNQIIQCANVLMLNF